MERRYPDVLRIVPFKAPPQAVVRPPGSKSITNRALLCAAMAPGASALTGILLADDTRAMLSAVRSLGAHVEVDEVTRSALVTGTDPRERTGHVTVDARQSGTTSRFVLPVLALSPGTSTLTGAEQLRSRPFGPLVEALRSLGADVAEEEGAGRLPLRVQGPCSGGTASLPGHLSSQFLSGLLLAAPLMADGLSVDLTTDPVSVPYLTMTDTVMDAFGCTATTDGTGWGVRPGGYYPTDYQVEPDASAASYHLAAAAITGGTVTVEGLGTGSCQGDVRFADVLERMGALVTWEDERVTVQGTDRLVGVEVDMADISDTAQTLAAVAAHATTPTRVTGIGFIRGKETDRVRAIVTELQRAGVDAVEEPDGFTVNPSGTISPARLRTYDDHRMAMSLSLLGLTTSGIEIEDPGCVQKTYPTFFEDLERLRPGGSEPSVF